MLELLFLIGAVWAVILWAIVSIHVVRVDRRRRSARLVVDSALAALRDDGVRAASLEAKLALVTPLLQKVSRDMVLHTAADGATARDASDVLTAYLVRGWGLHIIEREASFHRLRRDLWRRTASLKLLFHLNHPRVLDLLEAAANGSDQDVASVAFALLGQSMDPRAVDLLIAALRQQRHAASRIAVHLEHSVQRPAEACRQLLGDPDPTVRFWGATLLGDYPELPWVEHALAPLVDDADARVRKGAIQSLGRVGDAVAGSAALRLLADPQPFVRAHAARALAELDRPDAAPAVAELLGDNDWWVRSAAKQSLEMMGPEVWPILMRCLDNPDGFMRNGAAEVFQNLGVLDDLIVMEAASDHPSGTKIELLRRIVAAGGTRLTDSLVERAGLANSTRVRQMLATIGLEQVGTS